MRPVVVLCLVVIQSVLIVHEVGAGNPSAEPFYNSSVPSASGICKITVVLTVCDSGNEYVRTNGPGNKLRRGFTEGVSRQIEQTLVLLKSMVIMSKFSDTSNQKSSCVEVIILSEARKYFDLIETQIFVTEKWDSSFTQYLKLRFVQATYPAGTRWIRNWYLPCATLRLFFAQIFHDYDSVIHLDTDIILFRPVQELWNEFNNFSKATIHGIFRKNKTVTTVNAGVILMNLTRMRNARSTQELYKIARRYAKILKYADQSVLNIYFQRRRKALYHLPCNWNYEANRPCNLSVLCNQAMLKSEGVGALHGLSQAFYQESSCVQEIFRLFKQVKLDQNFSLKTFIQELWDGVCKVSLLNPNSDSCNSFGGTIFKGLEQLLKISESETEQPRPRAINEL